MKVQAIITISIDAADAFAVRAHRDRLSQFVSQLRAEHGETRLEMKTRRPRRTPRAAPPPKLDDGFEIVRARYVG